MLILVVDGRGSVIVEAVVVVEVEVEVVAVVIATVGAALAVAVIPMVISQHSVHTFNPESHLHFLKANPVSRKTYWGTFAMSMMIP